MNDYEDKRLLYGLYLCSSAHTFFMEFVFVAFNCIVLLHLINKDNN